MSNYILAPACILLATHCACCGRALVDAISVETGVGPLCRERFGYDDAQGEPNWDSTMALLDGVVAVADVNPTMTPRDAVNKLVHMLAKSGKSIVKQEASSVFSAIAALGFTVLADRIAKRFHSTVEVFDRAAVTAAREAEIAKLRAEYVYGRTALCYANQTTPTWVDATAKTYGGTPEDFVRALSEITTMCRACFGTGAYRGNTDGACFRCEGRGHQNIQDAFRNRAYDAHRAAKGAARSQAA